MISLDFEAHLVLFQSGEARLLPIDEPSLLRARLLLGLLIVERLPEPLDLLCEVFDLCFLEFQLLAVLLVLGCFLLLIVRLLTVLFVQILQLLEDLVLFQPHLRLVLLKLPNLLAKFFVLLVLLLLLALRVLWEPAFRGDYFLDVLLVFVALRINLRQLLLLQHQLADRLLHAQHRLLVLLDFYLHFLRLCCLYLPFKNLQLFVLCLHSRL